MQMSMFAAYIIQSHIHHTLRIKKKDQGNTAHPETPCSTSGRTLLTPLIVQKLVWVTDTPGVWYCCSYERHDFVWLLVLVIV